MSVVSQVKPRKGRIPEFIFLVIALGIGLLAYILAYAGHNNNELPPSLIAMAIGLALLVFASHVIIRHFAPYADPVFFPIALLLNSLGIVLIYRISLDKTNVSVEKQFFFSAVGIIFMTLIVVFIRDHRMLRRFSWTSLIIGFFLLIMPLIPFVGAEINGARIWV
ncbi:MAG: FtsW/RodA/SpoVE family cell cycle protein, partial [Actinomycetaceae bacterium]|nr:FtsW/RodA/SpoVE family cell cycle protein [Actinomycetaceae bacterium]